MQQPNTNPNTTNPVVEVALIVIAGMLIIIGAVLLYLGKIDIGFASFLFVTAFSAAFGLLSVNLAYKVPSPTQQAQLSAQQTQLSAQQQTVQQIASQVLAVLPMFANLLHSHAPANVAVPPQAQQNQVPASDPRVQAAAVGPQPTPMMAGTAPTAVVRQPVQQPPVVQPTPVQPAPQATPPQAAMAGQQFKPFTPLPDISMPMASMPAGQPPAQP